MKSFALTIIRDRSKRIDKSGWLIHMALNICDYPTITEIVVEEALHVTQEPDRRAPK